MDLLIQTINLKSISEPTRHDLARQAYDDVFAKLWHDVSFNEFYKLFFTPAKHEKLFLFKTADQRLAGYLIFRIVEFQNAKCKYGIVRLSTNVLPAYFGQNIVHRLVFKESLKYFARIVLTGRKLAILFTANSPSSYCILKRRALKVYPGPEQPTPPAIRQMITAACRHLGIQLTDPHRLLTHYPARLNSAANQRLQSQAQEDDAYRFYMATCPNYDKGQALVTLMLVNVWEGVHEVLHQLVLMVRFGSSRRKRQAADVNLNP